MHPIPQRCARRPLAGGLVVPYVTLIHDGHTAFGVLDADKTNNAFRRRLCQICEQPLDERFFLLVRPADMRTGCSPEPALHPRVPALHRRALPDAERHPHALPPQPRPDQLPGRTALHRSVLPLPTADPG